MIFKSIMGAVSLCLLSISCDIGATPVRQISNLESITFWERTGGTQPNAYTFSVDSDELKTRLADPLGAGNHDIEGVIGSEYYDVFYSDAEGAFNIDGEYLTIEGIYNKELPASGGLNLAEIGLNYSGNPSEYGNVVASFVALGDNAIPENVNRAIDGDLFTHTTMGNTVGQNTRLRLTLGFLSSSGPVPVPESSLFELILIALLGAGFVRMQSIGHGSKIS